jgi:hypothetical protein
LVISITIPNEIIALIKSLGATEEQTKRIYVAFIDEKMGRVWDDQLTYFNLYLEQSKDDIEDILAE